jgi:hypothetical protein
LRQIFLLIISFIIISCSHTKRKAASIDYTGFKEQNIILAGLDKELMQSDTLAIMSIKIPTRLDTFYQWHRDSDCLPCGELQYRFGDKNYQQFSEGGFFWTYVPDSVYQITIRHKPIKEIPDSIKLFPFLEKDTSLFLLSQSHNLTYDDTVYYISKKYQDINNRAFVIFTYKSSYGYLTQKETLFVVAATNLSSRTLFIIGECGGKDTTGFIDNIHKSILSIRIKEKE